MMAVPPPKRIAVIGCSGAGKSTLAAALADRLVLPYVPSDHVFWSVDWKPMPKSQWRAWLANASAAESWVIDGNFDSDRDLHWARADLVLWLDLPRRTILRHVLRRNLGWWMSRKPVWGGRRMTLRHAISGVRHAARSHGEKRHDYPGWLAELPQDRVVRLGSVRASRGFLSLIR